MNCRHCGSFPCKCEAPAPAQPHRVNHADYCAIQRGFLCSCGALTLAEAQPAPPAEPSATYPMAVTPWQKPKIVYGDITAAPSPAISEPQHICAKCGWFQCICANVQPAISEEEVARRYFPATMRGMVAEQKQNQELCLAAICEVSGPLLKQLATVTAERDRQYEFNAGQIAKFAAVEAENVELRERVKELERKLEFVFSSAKHSQQIEACEVCAGIEESLVDEFPDWMAVVRQLELCRETLEWLDKLGGLGYEKHDRIRTTLQPGQKGGKG